jgi:hypothetical protein
MSGGREAEILDAHSVDFTRPEPADDLVDPSRKLISLRAERDAESLGASFL